MATLHVDSASGRFLYCTHCGEQWEDGVPSKGYKHAACLGKMPHQYCAVCGGEFRPPFDLTYVHYNCLARKP